MPAELPARARQEGHAGVLTRPRAGRTGTGRAGLAVAVLTARRAVRSGGLWGYVFGATVASSAIGYAATYRTAAQRDRLAQLFGSSPGLNAINGPAREIQTVAGYTVWKSAMFLIVVGAVWGLLTSTKVMRGEEDAGRWDLLLAGLTTRRGAAAQALGGLAAGLAVLWLITAVVTVVAGRWHSVGIAAGPALYFALTLAAAPAMFLAAGAVTSQLAATRRQAAAQAGAALGVCYALRLVADSGTGLSWLRWVSPLGWIEELRPLTGPRPLVLLPIAALTAGLAGLAVWLAGRRDTGAGLLADRATAAPRTALLGGAAGLAVRLLRPSLAGWATAIGALALLMGLIARQAGEALGATASLRRALARLGAPGGGASQYLGLTFVMIALLVALVAASQVSAARGEEAGGRLDALLGQPLSRGRWLAGRAGIAVAALIAGGLLAGILSWAAAASQQAGVALPRLLAAGLNTVPPAVCVLGAGILALGLVPRAAAAVTYGVIAWSLLIELAGGVAGSSHWLLDTSVFHQMSAAPAVSPDWASAAALTAVGLAAALAGGLAFTRRDLSGA